MLEVLRAGSGYVAMCGFGLAVVGCGALHTSARPMSARAPRAAVAEPAQAAPKSEAAGDERAAAAAVQELAKRLHARFPDLQAVNMAVEVGMHQTDVTDADTDAAETFVVTVSEDKTARVWETTSGKQLAVMRLPGPGQTGELFGVAVAPKGDQVALGGYDGNVYLFDTSTWRLARLITPHNGTIHQLRYSRDGQRLAVGFHGHHGFRVYETEHYTPIFAADDFDGDIYGIAFSPSGQLAVSSWERTVRLYSEKYRLLSKQTFATRPYRVAFDPSGKRIVVGFLDTATARVLSVPELRTERELEPSPPGNTSSLGTVAFARDGSQIFASGRYKIDDRNPILRWKSDYSELEPWFAHHNTPERLLALKGGSLLLASQDPLVALFEPSGSVKWSHASTTPEYGTTPAASFEASTDASVVAFAWGRGQGTRVGFDVRRLALLDPDQHPTLGHAVTASPRVTVSDWLNTRDPSVGGQRLDVERFETCRALSIAAAGVFLLGCEWNVYLFDDSGRRLWKHGTAGSARGAYLSDDARVAAVALDDGTVRWLNGSTGEELVTVAFNGPTHDWVAWTPEGFFSGTPDGERMIGLNLLLGDGHTEFASLQDYAELMRRPEVVSRALDALVSRTSGPNLASL